MWLPLVAFAVGLLLNACNKDDVIVDTTPQSPKIHLSTDTGIFTVKSGRELQITPTYENVDKALYVWTIDGKIVGQEPTLSYVGDAIGSVYVDLQVSTRYGTATEELCINVVDLETPYISLAGADEGFVLMTGETLQLSPVVAEVSIPTTYTWTLDDTTVSSEQSYLFVGEKQGSHTLTFTATNEDGSDSITFTVRVCTPEELPFAWVFDQTTYHVSLGRSLQLTPFDITNAFDATYTWSVDGTQVQQSKTPAYIFAANAEGSHTVVVTMTNAYTTSSQQLTVEVAPAEGRYYRASSTSSEANWNTVYAYLPGPGQYVNEGYTATTMEEACAYATTRLSSNSYISLGGFGGYVVVGFDHSIDNSGDYDFAIQGNSFDGSSEPGIVWVMQDENGDGLPNDTWYELRGSETGKTTTLQNYAVTYYRPKAVGMSVSWQDNQGQSGTVDYLGTYHNQDYYYPNWVSTASYTLRGTRLAANNYDQSGNGTYWINPSFEWGYADNYSSVDRLKGDATNFFKISNAMTYDGQAANLRYIDFVKVQTGVNAKSGWLGEISPEVLGVYDYHLKK
jgi:hypothetical protein